MKLLVLQHVVFEGPASISRWAEQSAVTLQPHCCANNTDYPELETFDGLIIMGGPMSVNDDLDWLEQEKVFLTAALNSNKPILGICLGAQLIASCMGAVVSKHHQREIGWFDVCSTGSDHWLAQTLPEQFTPLHWHGDTFAIPDGCSHLFRSTVCDNQAFAHGDNVLGLPSHLEFDDSTAQRVGEACPEDLEDSVSSVQSLDEILADAGRFGQANALMFKLLDGLFLGDR